MFKRIALISLAALAFGATAAFADDAVKGPFAGTVHATASITYVDGTQQSWAWDRGKVTTLSSSSITLTRRDKAQATFAITSSTVVRNDGATYSLTDVKVGQVATVVSQNGNADIIRRIRGEGAPSGGDPSEIDGPVTKSVTGSVDTLSYDGTTQTFEYDRGRIAEAGSGSLTLVRPDKQKVTLTYDSATVLRDCHGRPASTDTLAKGDGGMFFSQGGALKLAACVHAPQHSS